jgi:hypothetical protein
MYYYILDENKDPRPAADVIAWNSWMDAHVEALNVAYDKIEAIRVSTDFTGIDLGISSQALPMVFETLVIERHRGEDTFRFATWDAALVGHRKIVRSIRRKVYRRYMSRAWLRLGLAFVMLAASWALDIPPLAWLSTIPAVIALYLIVRAALISGADNGLYA